MTDRQKSYVYASLVFFVVFTTVAVDSGIIPHFESIGNFFGRDGSSMLPTLTAFNGALVAGLLYGSLFIDPRRLGRSFLAAAAVLAVGGLAAGTTGSMPVWLSAWGILGFVSGLLSHLTWEFTLNAGHPKLVTTRMISAQLSARPVALALGVPIFALLSSFRGWSLSIIAFCLAATLPAVVLGIAILRPGEDSGNSPAMPGARSDISASDTSLLKHYKSLGNPGLLYLNLGHFFHGMSYLGLYGVLGIILTTIYGHSPEKIGYVFGTLGAVEGCSAFISPILFRRYEQITLVRFFSFLSISALLILFSVPMKALLFTGWLIVFVFSSRQLIFASFRAAGEAIALVAPDCPVGTFAIMSAWAGFSFSALVLEKALGSFGMLGCAGILIGTYFAGLVFFSKFFLYDFQAGRAI